MRNLSIYLLSFLLFSFELVIAKTKVAEIASEYYMNSSPEAGSVQFARIVFNVPSTKKIGTVGHGAFCARVGDFTLSDNRFVIDDSMFVNTFTEILGNANYVMAGNPNSLFNDRSSEPRYLIGAVIKDMEYDVCGYNDIFKGEVSKGENYMIIEWQVFDTRSRTTVFTVDTEGYAKQRKAVAKGAELALQDSFKGAVYNLLANKDFYDLVQPQNDTYIDPDFEQIGLQYVYANQAAEEITLEDATEAVVTIKASGHGSGFIISQDGYILTNQHVVGDLDTVTVTFKNGMEVEGQVVRRAKVRDVALVKIPLSRLKFLALQPDEPDVGSNVYTIGSPLDADLSSTVSQGIISAFRMMDDLEFIQSDAQTNPGNSGGPMVDDKGNVVAITVSGRTDGEGVNFFIPIEFALESLNIAPPEAEPSRYSSNN